MSYNAGRIERPHSVSVYPEDTLSRSNSRLPGPTMGLFGVYDGHGGEKAANYLKDNLHINILNQKQHLQEGNIREAILAGFLITDKQFRTTARAEGWNDGSTALVIILTNNKLVVGHVGDTRAVLCRGKRALEMTSDHKPDRPDELDRIESEGGEVTSDSATGWVPRVNGHLAVSRAFGDIRLKEPVSYVIADPELNEIILVPDDQFIIVASDGLWDVITNQEAVDTVRKCSDKSQAALMLVNRAMKLGSNDNITVLVVWLSWTIEYANLSNHSSFSSGLGDAQSATDG